MEGAGTLPEVESTSRNLPVETDVIANDQSTSEAASRGTLNRSNNRSALKRKRGSSTDSKSKPKVKRKKSKTTRTPRPNYTIEEGEDMLLIISNVNQSDSVWRPKRKGRKKNIKKLPKKKGQGKITETRKTKKHVRTTVIVDTQAQGSDPDHQVEPRVNVSLSGDDTDRWGQRLPVEVLVNIFQYVVHRDGAVPFLCRVSRVCRLWNDAASSPNLWRSVTMGFCWIEPGKSQLPKTEMRIKNTVNWMAQNRLSQLREFSLCHWKKNVDYVVQALSESCPQLSSLKLSHCTGVTDKAFQSLGSHCKQLECIDVQNTDVQGEGLVTFLETYGHQIRKIFFSYGSKSEKLLTVISKGCCPELRSLAVNTNLNTGFSQLAICIPALQIGCPKLQAFSMMNVMPRLKMIQNIPTFTPGFPLLEELCIATTSMSSFSDQDLNSLLHGSPRLRVLDLRGCSRVTPTALSALPCQALECLFWGLYFNSTSVASSKNGLHLLTEKWSRTLRELDITNHAFLEEDLEIAMGHLALGEGAEAFRSLNLTGTKLTSQALRLLIGHAVALNYLNLSSCRYLPRGMNKLYRGQEDIHQLLDKIE
ncbi:F-box/LRR-repeat protein 6 isoform X2 [Clupea harengus]|uniref:F-box/LRR-repeat protein 6 isoform X2 n=1 Tax=Clupea harengus TaxID=7950 RepID=A0A8M1KRB5_CLUHA|nr:F-box/LRR-repeat protein 6 isoform X2 [Clupea harengus]